jgi:hypothetical protein
MEKLMLARDAVLPVPLRAFVVSTFGYLFFEVLSWPKNHADREFKMVKL